MPANEWRLPPGLKHSLPFYARKPWVKLGQPILLFEHLHRTYGNIAHYRFMGTPIIFVNEPDYIREILVTQAASFVKERTVKRMRILLGDGLITSEEPFHMRQRRIAAPAFHRQRINAYADQIVQSAVAASERMQPGVPFDISAASMELSLEIVARTLFDTHVTADIRSINDEVNAIMELYNFIVAFPRIEKFLNLPIPGIRKFRKSKARLDAVVDRLIRDHRAAMQRGETASSCSSSSATPPASMNPCPMYRSATRSSPSSSPATKPWPTASPGPGICCRKTTRSKPNSTANSTPFWVHVFPPSPTIPRCATPSRSSPNPCASIRRPGRWAA
jgi:cytochrome P450